LFNINDFPLWDHPVAALFIGIFGALILLGVVRKMTKMVSLGITGLAIAFGFLVWRLSG
jgi:hypothetical protein